MLQAFSSKRAVWPIDCPACSRRILPTAQVYRFDCGHYIHAKCGLTQTERHPGVKLTCRVCKYKGYGSTTPEIEAAIRQRGAEKAGEIAKSVFFDPKLYFNQSQALRK